MLELLIVFGRAGFALNLSYCEHDLRFVVSELPTPEVPRKPALCIAELRRATAERDSAMAAPIDLTTRELFVFGATRTDSSPIIPRHTGRMHRAVESSSRCGPLRRRRSGAIRCATSSHFKAHDAASLRRPPFVLSRPLPQAARSHHRRCDAGCHRLAGAQPHFGHAFPLFVS